MNSPFKKAGRHFFLVAIVLIVAGCTNDNAPPPSATSDDEQAAAAMPTNRIAIPAAVRSNLGITFAQVEVRQVEQTLRVPGRFEYLPTARRAYRTMLPGRVILLVEQFERVDAGQVLYRIESPAWRELQQKISDADASIKQLVAREQTFGPLLEAHEVHEQGIAQRVALWEKRVREIEEIRESGGGMLSELAEARAALVSAQSELGEVREKDAQLSAEQTQVAAALESARSQRSLLLETAAMLLDTSVAELIEPTEQGRPRWRAIVHVDVRAQEPGVVESLDLTNGAWADEQASVMTIVDPQRLRFRASGLQSDLGALRDGLSARVVPPTPTLTGRSPSMDDTMAGTLMLGLAGNEQQRTIDLFVVPESLSAWARPGVSAQLEIVTGAAAQPQLAIPLSAVQRDGLVAVIFKRAPDNPNEAIRIEADLGRDDGRWVEVRSGLTRNDEVVLDGAFQLMLATSGSMPKGGHFHSDGSWHEGDH